LSNSRFSNNSLCGRGSRRGFLKLAKKSILKLVSHTAVPLCQVYFDRQPTERLNGFADRAIELAFPSSSFPVRPSLFNQPPFLAASPTCKEIKNQPLLRCRHLEHLPIMNGELIGIDVTLTLNNGVMDTIIVAMDVSLEH